MRGHSLWEWVRFGSGVFGFDYDDLEKIAYQHRGGLFEGLRLYLLSGISASLQRLVSNAGYLEQEERQTVMMATRPTLRNFTIVGVSLLSSLKFHGGCSMARQVWAWHLASSEAAKRACAGSASGLAAWFCLLLTC